MAATTDKEKKYFIQRKYQEYFWYPRTPDEVAKSLLSGAETTLPGVAPRTGSKPSSQSPTASGSKAASGSKKETFSYECVYTTLQQFYAFSSYSDILYNDIKASSRDIVTNAAAIYTQGSKAITAPVVMADWTIRSDLQRTDVVDSGTIQNYIGPDGVYSWMGIRPGEDIAITYAQSYIVEKLHDMYQGELIVRGTPAVKPYDAFYMNDSYTHMYGLAEVGRVVHSISPRTGFITSIKPDMITRHVELNQLWIDRHRNLLTLGSLGVLHGLRLGIRARQMGSAYLKARGTLMASKAASLLKNIKPLQQIATQIRAVSGAAKAAEAAKVAGTAAAGTAAAGIAWAAALGALAIELVVAGLINNLIKTVSTFFKTLQTVKIYPLYLKDKPYVAGISGAKYLIAYGPYDEVMADSDIGMDVMGSPGQRSLPNGSFLGPPSDRAGTITSRFGQRRDPNNPRVTHYHHGVDIAFSPANAPIVAVQAGTVRKVGYDPDGYGYYVVVDHGSGIETLYAHLSLLSVKAGQKVNAGSVLGKQGATGNATGPHLHIELRIDGKAVDILPYLPPACYQG